jgi:hypothetical protein
VPFAESLNKSGELSESENDLKKLIDSINNSKKFTTFSAFSNSLNDLTCSNKEKETIMNAQTSPDLANENLLIENLNNLKYENELINNLIISQKSSWNNPANSIESKFNFSSLDSLTPAMSNECLSRISSSSGFPSSISSSSATSSSSASPIIFSKCLEDKSEKKFNLETLANNKPQSDCLKTKKQLTRCKVVNLLLFPELQQEKSFTVKK